MREQLSLLYKVQTIDTHIQSSQDLERKYQADIEKLQNDVVLMEEQVRQSNEQLMAAEKAQRDRERQLAELEEKKTRIEDRMLAIKTNKEYHAALHETEKIKEIISRKEDELIAGMDVIEGARQSVREADGKLQVSRSECEDQKRRIENELRDFLAKIEKEKEARDEIVKAIKPDIFTSYTRIRKTKNGRAVALADNEQCLGCNMKIPPQIYNEVVLGEKLIVCPHCNRILCVDRNGGQSARQG